MIIAVLCSLAAPANCREQAVTTSDFADVSMQSCLMGVSQLADWMKQHPAERLAAWRCVIGKHNGAHTMRSLFAFGLLMTLCASASAASGVGTHSAGHPMNYGRYHGGYARCYGGGYSRTTAARTIGADW